MTWETWYLGCLLKFPLAEPQLFPQILGPWAQLFLYFNLPSSRSLVAKEADMHPHGGFHLPYMTGDGSSASASYAAAHAIGPWEKFRTGITAMAGGKALYHHWPHQSGLPLGYQQHSMRVSTLRLILRTVKRPPQASCSNDAGLKGIHSWKRVELWIFVWVSVVVRKLCGTLTGKFPNWASTGFC